MVWELSPCGHCRICPQSSNASLRCSSWKIHDSAQKSNKMLQLQLSFNLSCAVEKNCRDLIHLPSRAGCFCEKKPWQEWPYQAEFSPLFLCKTAGGTNVLASIFIFSISFPSCCASGRRWGDSWTTRLSTASKTMLLKSQQSSFPDRKLEMWNALSLPKLPSLFLFLAWLCSYLF